MQSISAEKAIDIAKTIFNIKVSLKESNQTIEKTIINSDEQKYLVRLFDLI
jgi:Zn-dependent metalloprotease